MSLIAAAMVVALGITSVSYDTDTPRDAAATYGTFVQPSDEDLNERLFLALPEMPASRDNTREKTKAPSKETGKAATKTKPKSKKPAARWVNPVSGAKITSCYGARWGRTHKGIDFAAPAGRQIKSVGAGKVVQSGWRYSGLGYSVVVDHGDGSMTLYGHASRLLVRTGQKVSAGEPVALVGSTGNSTGNHLHLGLAKTRSLGSLFDRLVNPAPWLKTRGISVGKCG